MMGVVTSCCRTDRQTHKQVEQPAEQKEPYSLYPVITKNGDHVIELDNRLSPYAISPNKLVEAADMEEVNEINVEETLHQIQNNDTSLTHCIFNNVPIEQEMVDNITSAMVNNTNVTKLEMCNCAITDDSVDGFITLLKTNKTLESLSLETNKITGKHLKLIVVALEFNDTLKELRIANQYYTTGVGDEMAISKALANNTSIMKFSLNWKNGGARNTADRLIMRNNDVARKKRQGLS